jgi:hypothetical protein
MFRHEHEYEKIKVSVDSLEKNNILLVESGSDIIVYKAYYTNPEGEVTIRDDTYYLFKSKNEKPNIAQFSEYYEAHHDSIQVWYHPKLKDFYAKESEINFRDRFDWIQIIFNSLLFVTAISTILYLIIKYIIIKKLINKN